MRLTLSAAVLAALPGAAAADTLRCGSQLVSSGDPAARVLAVCGEPAYRDAWLLPDPAPGSAVRDTEEWYYDFGSNQLLRILRFRHGRLERIDTDGYGYDAAPATGCEPHELRRGLSKYRLLLLCGEPASRETLGLLRPLHPGHGARPRAQAEVYRERWVYDFGPSRFMREVTLENGRVTDLDHRGRGFEQR